MAEEELLQPADRGARSQAGLLTGLQGAEASALQLRINNSICKSIQSKVENILLDVEKFSDIEKLYLYLKLPSGPSSCIDKSDQSALSSSRTQQMHAINWIRHHLEEYPETSLPKQEVYDEYKSFCDNLNYHPLSAADFGKIMKNVFPNMKARRLGMRGKSKYCYSGLRKRPFVQMPSLPSLDLHTTGDGLQCDVLESQSQLSNMKEDVRFAACDLVCEWAQKVLKRQFDAVEDLARFLIDSHYISNKSLAALTIVSGSATEVKPPQAGAGFLPTTQAHSFQPHVTTLSSPSVDAKQQLQRKIQRKQQEQKLHSPLPGEGQTKRGDDSAPCPSPTSPSPQATIGIVVSAVSSPITVQRSRQLLSPTPMGAVEGKMLPINIQMVTQPVQTVKPNPKTPQNILTSPVGERTARQRYAQILPKPVATTAVTLRSPSTMIIGRNPVKTVMTACHVSPVSLVQMKAVSLAPDSTSTATSPANATLRPASAGVSCTTVSQGISSNQSTRSTSAVPILTPFTVSGQIFNTQNIDVEMEVEAIHEYSQMQNRGAVVFPQETMANRPGGALQRAASVPIPQSKGVLGVGDTSITNCSGIFPTSSNAVATVGNSDDGANETRALYLTPSTQNTSAVSLLNTSTPPSFGGSSSLISVKEGFPSTKSLRKRSGHSPHFSPIKRAFIPQQPIEGAACRGYEIRNTFGNILRPGAPTRPESAPAAREVETKMISLPLAHVFAPCTSSVGCSGFYSVAKTQSSIQRKGMSTVMETCTSVSHPFTQKQQGHTMPSAHGIPNNPGLQTGVSDVRSSATASLEQAQQHTYPSSVPVTTPLGFLNPNPASSSHQLSVQTDTDYFTFDDDVTQDSIVEELVQMEEQMKLKNLQEFGLCAKLQGQQVVVPDNATSNNQTMTSYHHAANCRSNPIHTPTPTPTPTSEMMGGIQGFTSESPFSRIASTTPVESALGSSRHTPVGTPHSNCSSTVPPSPVECRNQFAFTPISNSSITGFHDGSTISSSPVKPMQRPMATHPDKTRLEWMNNSYNSSNGGLNKANSGMGILPSYQSLIGDHFQKPHAFAVPHARHHDSHLGRLTPISPVQQQGANMGKQEGFAVPAPLDNKSTNSPSTAFRCRSVSPAVHQRNFGGNPGNLPHVPRSVASPFNSPVTPEMLNIFAHSQTHFGVNSMSQRSHSVPLNIMMQTEVGPTPGQHCNSENLSNVLLSKLDGDHDDSVRGLGVKHLSSSYTARMNLTQILESDPSLSCSDHHFSLMTSDSTSSLQRPNYLIGNGINEQMMLSLADSQVRPASRERHLQKAQSALLTLSSEQHQEELQQQLDFSSTVKDLLADDGLTAGSQLMDPGSELTAGAADFPCEIRMTSELSGSINDLNAMDTDLLFDPNHQQGQYLHPAAEEEFVNDVLFQQITSDTAHSSGLDWLESKDHPTVGLMS
ncbi:DNA-binding protein RFX7-like [Spinachia spinachia]